MTQIINRIAGTWWSDDRQRNPLRDVEHISDYPGGLWTSAGFAQITPDFNLPLEDVAAFNLQTRPYTRIEFRNVSLHPGKLQKIACSEFRVYAALLQSDGESWARCPCYGCASRGRTKAMPGNRISRIATTAKAIRNGIAPRKIVSRGTSRSIPLTT
jgi:hypothetical protein